MPAKMNLLFEQIHNVPQIPEVVKTLINQLNNPNADFEAIAHNVEKEQMISLKVLRLVNSAHFGLSRKINSIDEAILIVGMSTLKTLIIASGLVNSVPVIENFNIKQFWSNSFRSATYSKWFAQQAKISIDIAYTAGLLSNLGNILIHLGAPSEANEIDQHVNHDKFRIDMEKKRLGYTSQQVCAELCRRWKLADELINAIENSGEPLASEPYDPLACAIYLGHFIGDCQDQGKSDEEIIANFPLHIAAQLGINEELISQKISEITSIESELEGLAE
jgi:HD-like signal output (HDOD) protein